MRTIIIGALALAGVALAAPANAQSVQFGISSGSHYGYSEPHYGSGHYYAPNTYRDHQYAPNTYQYQRPYRQRYVTSYAQDYRQCHTVKVWREGHWHRVKRCW